MSLTTTRVKQIDDAIASRLHIPIEEAFGKASSKRLVPETEGHFTIIGTLSFLHKKTSTVARYLGFPTERSKDSMLTIRVPQIRNAISTAYALATRKRCQVNMSHLEVAIAAGEDFEYDFRVAGQVANSQSYAWLSVVTG
jgi:hypothetical protein